MEKTLLRSHCCWSLFLARVCRGGFGRDVILGLRFSLEHLKRNHVLCQTYYWTKTWKWKSVYNVLLVIWMIPGLSLSVSSRRWKNTEELKEARKACCFDQIYMIGSHEHKTCFIHVLAANGCVYRHSKNTRTLCTSHPYKISVLWSRKVCQRAVWATEVLDGQKIMWVFPKICVSPVYNGNPYQNDLG